jgi:hypothetical protein
MILKEQSFVKRYNIHKQTRRNGAYEYVSTSGPPTYEQKKLNLFWQQYNKQIYIHQAMLNALFNFRICEHCIHFHNADIKAHKNIQWISTNIQNLFLKQRLKDPIKTCEPKTSFFLIREWQQNQNQIEYLNNFNKF